MQLWSAVGGKFRRSQARYDMVVPQARHAVLAEVTLDRYQCNQLKIVADADQFSRQGRELSRWQRDCDF